MMKLITEEIEKVEVITESVGGKKSLFIKGIFLQAEQVNRNGRMYRMPVMEREVKRYTEQYVNKGRALGELGHPDGPTVNLDRVSHKITELYREGNNFVGKAQILSTPMGKIAESLLKEGVCLGVSSRGIGSLRETREGYKEVGEDFMLATAADIVADPSAPDAFVQGIMEGKEWVWDGNVLREKVAENTRRKIDSLVDQRILEDYKLSLFNEFLNSL
jgi:Prohead core protein serine protease